MEMLLLCINSPTEEHFLKKRIGCQLLWFSEWVQWRRLPPEHAVKYLVKLFIDLGKEVFPASFTKAFKRKTSQSRQSLPVHITYPFAHDVDSSLQLEIDGKTFWEEKERRKNDLARTSPERFTAKKLSLPDNPFLRRLPPKSEIHLQLEPEGQYAWLIIINVSEIYLCKIIFSIQNNLSK